MKISVAKNADDAYTLKLDETEVALDREGLRTLMLEITRILMPVSADGKSAEEEAEDFIRGIKTANDIGIQALLGVADQDDILVLLKIAENDTALLGRLYGNMSERSRTIFVEDLNFKYKEGVPARRIGTAIGQLKESARQLEAVGTLVYEDGGAAAKGA